MNELNKKIKKDNTENKKEEQKRKEEYGRWGNTCIIRTTDDNKKGKK